MEFNDVNKSSLMVVIPLFLFLACLVVSLIIMPDNFSLVETRQTGFLCDSLDLENPQPCPTCKDVMSATFARILFGISFVFLLSPFVISFMMARREATENAKSLDLME